MLIIIIIIIIIVIIRKFIHTINVSILNISLRISYHEIKAKYFEISYVYCISVDWSESTCQGSGWCFLKDQVTLRT